MNSINKEITLAIVELNKKIEKVREQVVKKVGLSKAGFKGPGRRVLAVPATPSLGLGIMQRSLRALGLTPRVL